MESIIGEIVKASPYLGFILLFIWFEAYREDKRIANATALETRREEHENVMQEKQIKHDNEVLTLFASFNQQLIQEIKSSHGVIMSKIDKLDEETEKRYARLSVTQDLLKAAAAQAKRRE